MEDGSYSDTNNNDYTDHNLELSFDWRADIRHLLELSTTFERAHDDRSPDSVTGLGVSDLNEYEDRSVDATYTFGADGARGRVVINYRNQQLRYQTNIVATQVLDSDSETIDASIFIGIGATTKAIFQISNVDTEFNNNSIQNRQDRSYLIGAEWDISGQTTGSLRLGHSDSDLLNTAGDTSQSTGAISLEWAPYEYSTFSLSASKSAQNTENNVGSFIDRSEVQLGWSHNWSDDLNMQLSFSQQKDDFIGVNRNDDTNTLQFGVNYTVRRWLRVGVAFTVDDKTSSDSSVEFDRNAVTFSLSASL